MMNVESDGLGEGKLRRYARDRGSDWRPAFPRTGGQSARGKRGNLVWKARKSIQETAILDPGQDGKLSLTQLPQGASWRCPWPP